jgi:hypothetical protein
MRESFAGPLIGLLLLVVGALGVVRLAQDGGPYRLGPWPGLSRRGAGLLLGCAALLAGLATWLGAPQRAVPDLVLLAGLSSLPLVLASLVVQSPGAAAAACGAYLLPRSLLSLLDSSLDPPPLLLVPTLAFEVAAWLRASDLRALATAWPRHRVRWQRRDRRPRSFGLIRATLAGAVFGLLLPLVERPFALLLGAPPQAWPLDQTMAAAVLAGVAAAAIGACVCLVWAPLRRCGRGTGR